MSKPDNLTDDQWRLMWALYELTYIEAKNTHNKQTDVRIDSRDILNKINQDRYLPLKEIIKRVRNMEKWVNVGVRTIFYDFLYNLIYIHGCICIV